MIAEHELLARFEGAKRNRDGDWHVLCPCHADKNPSLHVTLRDDRWLFSCMAGCQTPDVLQAVDLDWSDMFAEDGHREEVETYPYVDEQGTLLFEVVRYFPKDFRQRRPDGNGGWEWKLGDTRRVLYRLPRVLKAIEARRVVWIVEGERDVHALERAGQVATTSPGGAGKWRSEYAECFRGAKVAIVADRDDQGRTHARTIAASLKGVAAEVKIAEPAEGKDASDHLKAGRGLEEFVALEGRSSELRHPDPAPARPVRWVWNRRVAVGKTNLLVGNEGTGKGVVNAWTASQLSRGRLDGDLKGQPVSVLTRMRSRTPGRLGSMRRVRIGDASTSRRRRSVTLTSLTTRTSRGLRAGLRSSRSLCWSSLLDNIGATDAYEPRQVRAALRPLGRFARDTSVAVLGSLHPRKGRRSASANSWPVPTSSTP